MVGSRMAVLWDLTPPDQESTAIYSPTGAAYQPTALRAPPPDKDYSVDRGRDLSVDRLAEATGYKYNPKGAPSRFGSAGRNPHRPLGEGEDVPGGVRGEGYS